MLLAVDVGNTQTVLGLLSDERAGAVAIVRELGADPEALSTAVRTRS